MIENLGTTPTTITAPQTAAPTMPTTTQTQASPFGADVQAQIEKLNRLQVIAPMYGYSKDDVDRFVTQKRASIFTAAGVPISEISTDPILQGLQAEQIATGTYESKNSGSEAIARVLKQGGGSLLEQAKDPATRAALANDIEASGGVGEYRRQVPLDMLLTDPEREKIGQQAELLALVDQSIASFGTGDNPLLGTGPLAQFIPGFAAGEGTRSQRALAANVRAQYQKAISGATVSDAEAKRLEQFLPTKGKTEQENLDDLKRLRESLVVNQAIFERAKKEGLTANEAYRQYGSEIFTQFGLEVPDTLKAKNEPVTVAGYVMEVED